VNVYAQALSVRLETEYGCAAAADDDAATVAAASDPEQHRCFTAVQAGSKQYSAFYSFFNKPTGSFAALSTSTMTGPIPTSMK
jgi:hypothetical protein